jgi:hypothetical protein
MEDDLKLARSEKNRHKMFGGLQCECCAGGANGLRRRRRAPRHMLRALAQQKQVRHFPFGYPTLPPPSPCEPEWSNDPWKDEIISYHISGLSSWKKTLRRKSVENLW